MNLGPSEDSQPALTQVLLSPRLISELGDPHSTLRAITQRSGPVVIVRAGGEIDGANEHTWLELVCAAAAVASPPGPFVIDVNDVDFMGCCAFAVLADEATRCRERGVAVLLVSCNPAIVRIVGACGLDDVLRVHPTIDSALSAALV